MNFIDTWAQKEQTHSLGNTENWRPYRKQTWFSWKICSKPVSSDINECIQGFFSDYEGLMQKRSNVTRCVYWRMKTKAANFQEKLKWIKQRGVKPASSWTRITLHPLWLNVKCSSESLQNKCRHECSVWACEIITIHLQKFQVLSGPLQNFESAAGFFLSLSELVNWDFLYLAFIFVTLIPDVLSLELNLKMIKNRQMWPTFLMCFIRILCVLGSTIYI